MTRPPSFRIWLVQQTVRDDPVGDVARDVREDHFCMGSRRYEGMRNHLERIHWPCRVALRALEQAHDEYLREIHR